MIANAFRARTYDASQIPKRDLHNKHFFCPGGVWVAPGPSLGYEINPAW